METAKISRWLRNAAIAVVLVAAPAMPAALAQSDPMTAYYGNTLVCKAGGAECHIWFLPGGRYIRFDLAPVAPGADPAATSITAEEGAFAVRGNSVCFKKDKGGTETCRAGYIGKKLNDQWTAPAATGGEEHLELRGGQL